MVREDQYGGSLCNQTSNTDTSTNNLRRGGKRDRPASPPSFASTGDSMVNMAQVNAPSFFSFPSQHQQDGFMVNAAATVSPFMDRVGEDNMNNNIINNHLESVPEEQSHCNNYDLTQSSIDDHNSNSRLTFEIDEDDVIYYSNLPDCPPPTKRPRLEDDTTHHSSSFSIVNTNDVDMLDGSALPPLSPKISCKTEMKSELLTSSDSSSSSSNNDEGLVIRCCHVCSLEDRAENITTTTPHVEKHSVETLGVVRGGGGGGNNGPRSHSLLAYFQPTKRLPAMHHRALVSHYLAVVPSQHSSVLRDDVITLSSNNDINNNDNNNNDNNSKQHQQRVSNLSACRYCDKPTCITCTRQCEFCQHCYCIFCTKVNYESSVAERLLCFECDEQYCRNGSGASSDGYNVNGGSSRREDSFCDMIDNLYNNM